MFRATFSTLVLLVLITTLASLAHAWLLAQTGLNETYRVRHLSMHFSRVFLCISVKSHQFPTLIEAQWPETYLPLRSSIFPHRAMHANGNHSDCTLIQRARWSQVDSLSRLWVMDMGWMDEQAGTVICPPKLLAFDLIRNNAEVLRIDCRKYVPANETQLLAVKLGPKLAPCRVEKFIYFLLADDPHIIAYDVLEQKWQRRLLTCKKYKNVQESFPIKPNDVAFGKHHELLISDADGKLYTSTNAFLQRVSNAITDVDNELVDDPAVNTVELEQLGTLLGPSKCMMVDQYGALFYVVSKFGAVVRCEYKQNLTAEGNEIIYLTSKNIQQIFFGGEGSVWLLTDRLLKPQDHCFPDA